MQSQAARQEDDTPPQIWRPAQRFPQVPLLTKQSIKEQGRQMTQLIKSANLLQPEIENTSQDSTVGTMEIWWD